jgi:hypothetical protein
MDTRNHLHPMNPPFLDDLIQDHERGHPFNGPNIRYNILLLLAFGEPAAALSIPAEPAEATEHDIPSPAQSNQSLRISPKALTTNLRLFDSSCHPARHGVIPKAHTFNIPCT